MGSRSSSRTPSPPAARILPRDIDLSQYEVARGVAKNGVPYATLRNPGLPTVTAFGATADAIFEAATRDGVVSVKAYERMGSVKVVSMACPLTGLPIGEFGRLEPIVESSAPPEPTAPEEPRGWWARTVDAVRDALGIEDERPQAAPPPAEPGRTGYPLVDDLMDRIRGELVLNPDLVDASGGRFDLVVERHLPMLVAHHSLAVRGASRDETALADAMLSEGLRVTRESLDESLRADRGVRLDHLATSMNFLRSRHGMEATFEPVLTIEAPKRRLAAPASDREAGRLPSPAMRTPAHGPSSRTEDPEDALALAGRMRRRGMEGRAA